MKLIIGLGNPGKKYEKTRHNSGFRAVDNLGLGLEWKNSKKLNSLVAETKINQTKIILAKPQTFMNSSGNAAGKLANFYKIKSKDILIIYDDIDLMVGTIRLRSQGSSGGHKGLESALKSLKTEKIARIKIGVAENKAGKQAIPSEEYILKRPCAKAEKILMRSMEKMREIVSLWISGEKNKTASI